MNVAFVTGAAGFIGEYIVKEFVAQGWYVVALIHRSRSDTLTELERENKITCLSGDIQKPDALKSGIRQILQERSFSLDVVVHCAGRASDVGRETDFRNTNCEAVKSMALLCQELGGARFVFVSTTDVYGMKDFSSGTEASLEYEQQPVNPYPKYKIEAEKWLKANMSADGYSVVRPAQVWGLGDKTLTPRFVDFMRWSPMIIHFGEWKGQNRWPLAHVRNVAVAVFLAATLEQAKGQAVHVADDEKLSIDQFYSVLAELFFPGRRFRRVTIPFSIGYLFGACVTGISNLLNLDKPFTDPSLYALYSVSRNLDFDNSLLHEWFDAGERNLVTLEEGIKEIREDFLASEKIESRE